MTTCSCCLDCAAGSSLLPGWTVTSGLWGLFCWCWLSLQAVLQGQLPVFWDLTLALDLLAPLYTPASQLET